jgi:hypothetical protein
VSRAAHRSWTVLLLACGAWLALPGCQGYSTAPLADVAGTRTLAVRPFVNAGFRRDLELRLTHAVLDEVRSRGAWAIAEPGRADLVLEGEVDAAEDAIGLDEARRPLQKRLRGTLRIVLRERATGRVVREAVVAENEEFRPGLDGASLEGSATDAWVRRIARRAVDSLEAPF